MRPVDLMIESDLWFVDVATQLGCADRRHVTRAFVKHVVVSPSGWRRSLR